MFFRRSFRVYISLIASFLILPRASASQDEFGLWLEGGARHDFSKQWHASLSLGHRLEDNLSQPARWDAGLSLTYRPIRPLRLSAGYVYLRDHSAEEAKPNLRGNGTQNGWNIDEAFWRDKHRWYFDVAYKWDFAPRWTLALRERYQYTRHLAASTFERKLRTMQGGYTGATETYDGTDYMLTAREAEDKSASNRHYLRTRIGLEYHRKRSPYTPFFHYEIANNLAKDFDIVRHRFTLGSAIRLAKGHELTAAYVLQLGEIESGATGRLHAVSVGYDFKF